MQERDPHSDAAGGSIQKSAGHLLDCGGNQRECFTGGDNSGGESSSNADSASQRTITTGANIFNLHPSSVYARAAQSFTLRVERSGFADSTPGPGPVVLVGGTARTTAGMRCAGSEYELYNADATETLKKELSEFQVPCSVFCV
jgi:hypothetical protein